MIDGIVIDDPLQPDSLTVRNAQRLGRLSAVLATEAMARSMQALAQMDMVRFHSTPRPRPLHVCRRRRRLREYQHALVSAWRQGCAQRSAWHSKAAITYASAAKQATAQVDAGELRKRDDAMPTPEYSDSEGWQVYTDWSVSKLGEERAREAVAVQRARARPLSMLPEAPFVPLPSVEIGSTRWPACTSIQVVRP